ncbi:MAG: DUF475 domain-containing protein [Actinomycetota bacterium]|nr:DUF475 domain-containing protein [Actinomycetota bacterium]
MRIFFWSILVAIAALIIAFVYDSWSGLALCLILGVLEVSLSFDNAVVNATILERMSDYWQKIFLTIGVIIAVFGMRILFPVLIVGLTAHLSPVGAWELAMQRRPISDPTSYAAVLHDAHPLIAAFGGMFLLMLFLDFIFEERDIQWLQWLERPLARLGKLDQLSVVIAGLALVVAAEIAHTHTETVLLSGILGIVTYIIVNGLGSLFEGAGSDQEDAADNVDGSDSADSAGGQPAKSGRSQLVKATGRAAFFLFLYLEVLDASFSFDGVIGAFAITADPILIALGLGLIGAMFVRSLTVYLVRKGTLAEYVYLEHGAHWAIGALAVILLVSIGVEVNDIVTGLVGVAFIGAAMISSLLRNRKLRAQGIEPATMNA